MRISPGEEGVGGVVTRFLCTDFAFAHQTRIHTLESKGAVAEFVEDGEADFAMKPDRQALHDVSSSQALTGHCDVFCVCG